MFHMVALQYAWHHMASSCAIQVVEDQIQEVTEGWLLEWTWTHFGSFRIARVNIHLGGGFKHFIFTPTWGNHPIII